MKDLFSPLATLLVAAASINDAAAAGSNKDFLTELAASLQNSGPALTEGDWTSQLACTADMTAGTIIDEASCATAKDDDGGACLWCDATATLGQGVCASTSTKAMIGQLWDQMCGASSGTTPVDPPAVTPPAPVPATPMPTPKATPNPTQPAPAPAPDDDDPFSCMADSSGSPITDETTCNAQTKDCVWCKVPMLGGSCITSSMHSTVSFLCQSEEEENNNLRGSGGAWKQLDPSCLGDTSGLAGDKDSCKSRTDSDGAGCIWCDAGNDVFGICATSSQKDYIGGYMSCDAGQDVDAAVAVE